MLAKNIPVTIEADIKNTFHPNPPVFNVVGEIPGTDKADEIVMLGAHFDTWHAATGAADDGVGVAAMMEAMRILKATGVKLRRTVRIGLWEGEEQGLLGSREYVAAHLRRPRQRRPAPAPGAPAGARGSRRRRRAAARRARSSAKPEYDKFCRLLQHRQRHRRDARHLPPGQRRRRRRSSASGWSRSAASA